MRDLTASELRDHLAAANEPPLLLDVREEWEYGICRLEGSLLLPMGRLPAGIAHLEPARETVVICHHGIRSRMVAAFLERSGFTRVINLAGGVAAWARDVDPDMPVY
ncbi:sulfurtransferase [bacterium]|nr:sulfurtransferase [bacterium]